MSVQEYVREVLGESPGLLWTPSVGPETLDLLEHLRLDPDSSARLTAEAIRVLGKCVKPGMPAMSRAGLAVGYVQSGKTMSFTVLTALARDNGYQMVILIAGTSLPLFNQSLARMKKDLRLDSREDHAWLVLANPSESDQYASAMADALYEHDDGDSDTRTVLVIVMKHHQHLANVASLAKKLDLDGRPVLIIDDEADQASLNAAVKSGDQSTTYSRLLSLRDRFPLHAFVQYTATPQAPLLINIIDSLSPEFSEVLTPGHLYTGGAVFFEPGTPYVQPIQDADQELTDDEPPESLLVAMRVFFVGVAAALVQGQARGNRSMMVHPSQRTSSHQSYYLWVKHARALWLGILESANGDDRADLLEEFRSAWDDLSLTVQAMPSFSEISNKLPRALKKTRIHRVNAAEGQTPQVDWRSAYPHILVGGQAMDRGFTVEGLTVTYMPRRLGVGNADTIQQRARFFGYKRPYLGYCRVYLSVDAINAYSRYVFHEEDIRRRLAEHSDTGAPLSNWKRMFFLNRSLKPTRDSVLDLDYMRVPLVDRWLDIKAPHASPSAAVENARMIERFLSGLVLKEADGHPARSETMRHLVTQPLPLAIVVEDLLTQFKATWPSDSQLLTGLLLQLQRLVEGRQDALAVIFQMSGGKERERKVGVKGEIDNIFQGPHPDKHGEIYPGDKQIYQEDVVSVQIHNLKLTTGRQSSKSTVARCVPTLAVRVPGLYAEDLYVQSS